MTKKWFNMIKNAILSTDRVYRYTLERTWASEKEQVLFIMLNPSTADEKTNDQTITRCIDFATRWGHGGIVVANLFAFRSPKPRDLFQHTYPIGPENDYHLKRLAVECETVVVAWGSSAKAFPMFKERQAFVRDLLKGRMKCLATTNDGYPTHPMARGRHRVPDDATPRPFS